MAIVVNQSLKKRKLIFSVINRIDETLIWPHLQNKVK